MIVTTLVSSITIIPVCIACSFVVKYYKYYYYDGNHNSIISIPVSIACSFVVKYKTVKLKVLLL